MEWRGEGAKKKGSAITQAAGHNKQTISSVRGVRGAREGGGGTKSSACCGLRTVGLFLLPTFFTPLKYPTALWHLGASKLAAN